MKYIEDEIRLRLINKVTTRFPLFRGAAILYSFGNVPFELMLPLDPASQIKEILWRSI